MVWESARILASERIWGRRKRVEAAMIVATDARRKTLMRRIGFDGHYFTTALVHEPEFIMISMSC